MQRLTKNMLAKKRRTVLSGPTHKAVAVLARKLAEANIKDLPCRTIHSILGLTPKPRMDRLVFERERSAEPVTADVVVVDDAAWFLRIYTAMSSGPAQLLPSEK
jgi:hypothetical protein